MENRRPDHGLGFGGGYAEYCVAHESHALPVSGLSMVEAAAIPETFFTVWHNAFERGGLKSGETLLVHGGSSGIGTTAIQLAKAFGARVITTAGSPEKCDACRKLGADVAVNYKTEDFVAATKAATNDKGAEVIVDMVGGDYIARNYEAAAVEGRIVQIAFQGSPKATVDFRRIMLKRLHHTGSTLRARSIPDKGAIARAVEENVLPLIVAGKVKPVIYKTFPLKDAARGPCAYGNQRTYRQNRANILTKGPFLQKPRNRRNVGLKRFNRVRLFANFHCERGGGCGTARRSPGRGIWLGHDALLDSASDSICCFALCDLRRACGGCRQRAARCGRYRSDRRHRSPKN